MLPLITVGLDGSPESMAAAEWAAREALRRDLPVQLLLAWGLPPAAHSYGPHPVEAVHRHWAERIPREAAAKLRSRHPELTVTAEQVSAPPVDALLGAAAESELLVLGSRAVGAVSGYLMGSVSLAVTARSPRPVVLVRSTRAPGGKQAAPAPAAYPDVVLGLDLTHPDDRLIDFAFDAAARRVATLRVVHSRNTPLSYGYDVGSADVDLDSELAAQEADTFTRTIQPWRGKYPAVPVTGEAVVGTPARHLTEAAASASLLVIGRRPPGQKIGPRLGPVAHAVLHHSSAPVAVVPHD